MPPTPPSFARNRQAKVKLAKEKAEFDLRLSNLRGESRLTEKEAIAAEKAAKDPWKRVNG